MSKIWTIGRRADGRILALGSAGCGGGARRSVAMVYRLCEYRLRDRPQAPMTNPDSPNDVLPETVAAERLRRHLEEIARERDQAYRTLQEREAELARIQRIARVGGLE